MITTPAMPTINSGAINDRLTSGLVGLKQKHIDYFSRAGGQIIRRDH